MPVMTYLQELHLTSTHPIVVRPDDTLKSVVYKVLSHRIHRVWVIDDDCKPTAVITLGDILSKFAPYSPEISTSVA